MQPKPLTDLKSGMVLRGMDLRDKKGICKPCEKILDLLQINSQSLTELSYQFKMHRNILYTIMLLDYCSKLLKFELDERKKRRFNVKILGLEDALKKIFKGKRDILKVLKKDLIVNSGWKRSVEVCN